MNLKENGELITYYLQLLRLRKETSLLEYQPTPWEKLSKEEQLQLAAYHAQIRQEEDLEAHLLINQYNRENKAKKAEIRRQRISKHLNYSTFFFDIVFAKFYASSLHY